MRALARKHKCAVDDLAKVREQVELELQALGDGGKKLAALERAERETREAFTSAAQALSAKRRKLPKRSTRRCAPNSRR